jgi:hypothetical protein
MTAASNFEVFTNSSNLVCSLYLPRKLFWGNDPNSERLSNSPEITDLMRHTKTACARRQLLEADDQRRQDSAALPKDAAAATQKAIFSAVMNGGVWSAVKSCR